MKIALFIGIICEQKYNLGLFLFLQKEVLAPVVELLQDFIRFACVKFFGIKFLNPIDDFFVLWVLGIVECRQKIDVTRSATTIFRWTIAGATQTDGTLGFDVRQNFFHGQQMPPMVAKIVNVTEGIAFLKVEINHHDRFTVFQAGIGFPHFFVVWQQSYFALFNLKFKQMSILPTHYDLEDFMQIKAGFGLIYLKSTPDFRFDGLQLDF